MKHVLILLLSNPKDYYIFFDLCFQWKVYGDKEAFLQRVDADALVVLSDLTALPQALTTLPLASSFIEWDLYEITSG